MVLIRPDENGKAFYISALLKKNLDIWVDVVHHKNQTAVMIIDGRSGLGKTTLSFQLGKYFNPNFSLKDVAFTPEQFIEILRKAKKGDVCIFDEAMLLSSRSSMSVLNKAVILMMSQIRSKNIFVIFNVNSIFDLDKNLPLHRADLLLHVYSEAGKLGTRGRYAVFPSAGGKMKLLYILGKKFYSYARPKSVFQDRFSSYFPLDEKEYEKKKQIAINNFFTSKPQVSQHIKQRNILLRYIKKESDLTNPALAKIIKISSRTLSRVLNEEKKDNNE